MSLVQVFKTRVDRVARVLDNPAAGPKRIEFSSADLSNPAALAKLHAKFPRGKKGTLYLYQLSLDGEENAVASRAREAFRTVRAARTRNMSRDNVQHPDSEFLYVGSSEGLYDRFRTHLGVGKGRKTWALYLSAWAVPLNARFAVEYYEFDHAIAGDVELIEGVLWDSLRPLFGKKGGKGQ
jgi:hypothetical protein